MDDSGNKRGAWRWAEQLAGVVPPLITPLDHTGRVDPAAVASLVDYTLAAGCSGLFVAGGCGLGPWLTGAQRGEVVGAVVRCAAGKVPVLAGVMLPSTGPACEAARQAEAEGADAIVVASPYYFTVTGDDQHRHVEAVLEAVSLPVLLYNIPQCTVHSWLPRTVAALAREPRVVGVKDSSGNLATFQDFLAIKRERQDFCVLQGDERVMAACMLLGADGVIAGLANVAPRLFVDLVRAGAHDDAAACRQLQERITDLWSSLVRELGLAGLYAASAALGIGNGQPAAPWVAPSADQQRAIVAALRRHELMRAVPAGRA